MTLQQTTRDVRPSERVGDVLARIRRDASSAAEMGRRFEHLFMAAVRDNPEFDVADIWAWREWPEPERLTGLDGRDHGIDPVAALADGTVAATARDVVSELATNVAKRLNDTLRVDATRERRQQHPLARRSPAKGPLAIETDHATGHSGPGHPHRHSSRNDRPH